MPSSDSRVSFGRGYGLPLPSAYHEAQSSFRHAFRRIADRTQRRGWDRCLLGHPDSSWRGAGLPSYRAILFVRVEVRHTAGTRRSSPSSESPGVAFREDGPLGSQDDRLFGAELPPTHTFVRLRIDHAVTGKNHSYSAHDGRKAGYRLVGLHLGRTGFTPAG